MFVLRANMGRWGDELYESDSALDFLSIITDKLERELAFLISPDQVIDDTHWLAQVLAVIEMILLFEQYDLGSSVYLQSEKAVHSWREVFFSVWDGEWEAKANYYPYPYDAYEYRKQHRTAIIEQFEYLERIAHYWTELSSGRAVAHPESFVPKEYPLPEYSIRHWTTKDNKEVINVERFVIDLMGFLEREIIYWLSPEKRAEAISFDVEQVWVSVHLLGFLSEKYEQKPGVNERVVGKWRETTIEILKQFLNGDVINWGKADGLYLNVLRVFDKLEAMAKKYPPYDWSFGKDES
jgi:hypothetical protein